VTSFYFTDKSKHEAHRARLENTLKRAIAADKNSKVAGVKVTKLKLPTTWEGVSCSVLQCVACVAVCCSVSQCVAVCRSVLHCVAVCCSVS